jgi:PQQ-dependent dehydrogenase (methanol/ethanol family)
MIAPLIFLGAVLSAQTRLSAAPSEELVHFQRERALAGRATFVAKCASCHGDDLQGKAGPALRGELFRQKWLNGQRKFADLYSFVQQSMPVGAAASLPLEDYINVVLFVLSQNGYQPTDQDLNPSDMRSHLLAPANPAPVTLTEAADPETPFPQAPKVFGTATTAAPDDAELAHPDETQWLMYNKSLTGQRYSALDQINAGNAAALSPVCIFQPAEIGSFQTAPVVYRGVLYFTTPWNTFAIDPTNCHKLWEHRYPADKATPWTVNRGVAIYRGKLFRTTPDGHLIALDAATGKLLWDVWMVSKHHGYWLSAAPVAYQGRVFMGTAGADWGADGFVEAFDSESGKHLWTFHIIPTGKEAGAETWGKGTDHGGGSFWSSFAIDASRGQLLVPTGNPAPDFRPDMRPGDNLFTNSVVALDLATGKLGWWVQQVPHDMHDWDTAAAPMIYDLGGRQYMAVANKGGWLYIYDRATHALLSKQEVSRHENVDIIPTAAGVHHCPGTLGGVEWNGVAFAPPSAALFVNSVDWCDTTSTTADSYTEGSGYFDGMPALDPTSTAAGFLRAFAAADGKPLWVRRFDSPMVAGITPTSGGILFTGSLAGDFLAIDSATGKTLYSFTTGGAIGGAPSTFTIAGKQYVAVPSGNASRTVWQSSGAMMLMIFALR